MNSQIHDILEIKISELSTHELIKLEKKMMQSNKKLPIFIAQNLVTDSRHLHIIDTLEEIYEDSSVTTTIRSAKGTTVSCQKLLLDFLVENYPRTKINSVINLCRLYLCHDIARYLTSMLVVQLNQDDDENFPNETFVVNNRYFPRGLSQQEQQQQQTM